MTERIYINEVGLRDGLQSQPQLVALEGKLKLAAAIAQAGIREVEATSFASPKAVPQMADADALFPRLPAAEQIRYSALVPNVRGLERAKAANVGEIAVVLSATDTMNRRNINMNLAEARASCVETLIAAATEGMRRKAYLAVAFACPFEGQVGADGVLALAEEMLAAGAQQVAIADTIGAANPAQVRQSIGRCVQRFGADKVAAHFHDTRGFALANLWAAIEAGVRRFDCSLGGLGGCPFAPGAAGNVATEDVVLMVEQCGFVTGVDLAKLRAAIRLAETLVGRPLGGRTKDWLLAEDARAARHSASR